MTPLQHSLTYLVSLTAIEYYCCSKAMVITISQTPFTAVRPPFDSIAVLRTALRPFADRRNDRKSVWGLLHCGLNK